MMMTILLSTILAAAPIPKSSHDGKIAFVVNGQKPMLIILSPSGKEWKRMELNELDGRPYTVKLASHGEFVIVTTSGNQSVRVGNTYYMSSTAYLLPLDGKSKPELLFDNKVQLKWVLNQNATEIIASEIDVEKMAKPNANPGKLETKSWKYDIKTKKQTEIPIPTSYFPVDITSDDSTVLLYANIDGKYRTATAPTSTWKPRFIADSSDMPHGLSPDGKKIFLMQYPTDPVPATGERKTQLFIHDVKSKERRPIATPGECMSTMAYSYGADGKHVAMVGYVQERIASGFTYSYRVYSCRVDGSNLKLLFESAPGEYISDVDWR